MRFAYWPSAEQSWEQLLVSARHAEATGWDGLWVADHFVSFTGGTGPCHECWSLLAGLAAAVPRVRLGSLVTGNTYRNPALLAKIATTVDHISDGRVVLGLGAGWHEDEHRFYGFEFGTVGDRMDWLEEACDVVTSLFAQDVSEGREGGRYPIRSAPFDPKPVQARLPLLIGGGGEQRTLRIAARYADEWNIWGTPELLAEKGAVLDRRCEEIDRDPAEISRSAVALLYLSDDEAWLDRYRGRDVGRPTIVGTPGEVIEVIGRYRDAGVDEVIIPDFNLNRPELRLDVLSRFAAEVAPALR